MATGKRLTILHSNDVHSRLTEWARMETLARAVREEVGSAALLRLDAGDHSDRSFPVTEATRGMANIGLLGAAGVDAFVFGNNEYLVWPVSHQSALAEAAHVAPLCADLRLAAPAAAGRAADPGAPVPGTRDWMVLDRAGLKVGLFGLCRDSDHFLAELGLRRRDPATAAAECIAALRAQGCDLIILLSHRGIRLDRELAAAVDGIDIIVGGHSHSILPEGEMVGRTIIVQAGYYGQHLGRLDLTVVPGQGVTAWSASLLAAAEAPPHPETVTLIQEWEARGAAHLAEVVAYLPVPLPHDPLGESPLLEMMARRLLRKFDAEVSIIHGGVLLDGLTPGPVTYGDLLRICPCNLNPTIAEIPGRALLSALALAPEAVAVVVRGNGMRGDALAGRVHMVGLAPADLDPDRIYRVACNDYLSFGHGPFTPLRELSRNVRFEVDQLMRDTLLEALTGQGCRPGDPVRVEVYDLSGRRTKWAETTVVRADPDTVVISAGPGYTVYMEKDGRENWHNPYLTDYHFFPGKEYNLFRFYREGGDWAGDYFNTGLPPVALPEAIAYVDLDLDVYLRKDQPPRIEDEDELAAAPYPDHLKGRMREVARWLMAVAGTADSPGGPPPARRSPR